MIQPAELETGETQLELSEIPIGEKAFKKIPWDVWWSSLDNQVFQHQLTAPLEMKNKRRKRLDFIGNDETLNMCMSLIAIFWCGLKQNIKAIAIWKTLREYGKQKGIAKEDKHFISG